VFVECLQKKTKIDSGLEIKALKENTRAGKSFVFPDYPDKKRGHIICPVEFFNMNLDENN